MRLILSFIVITALAACAGRDANPVADYRIGDQARSCESIKIELSQIEADIARLTDDADKTGKNVALGVTGLFLIVPWFFMDFSDAEMVEVQAYRRRHNRLVQIAVEKGCDSQAASNLRGSDR